MSPDPATRSHDKRLWLGLRLLYWLLVLLIGALIGVSLAHTSRRTAGGGAALDRQAAAACVTFDQWFKNGGLDKSRHDALVIAAAAFISGAPHDDAAGLPPKFAAFGTHVNAALAAAANHSTASLQRRGHVVLDECVTILAIARG
jgi:hypothetical protein